MRLRSIFTLSLCLGLVLFALPAGAQSAATTGAIEGTVTDDSGGVLPGVSVALRNTATNYETTVTTGPNGRFRGLLLPLGPYRISASLSGFAKVVREGINVSVGQSVNVAITMSLAAKVEEILVTAENPVVETTRPEGSTRIDALALKEIPNNGRNFLEFTKLTPVSRSSRDPTGTSSPSTARRGSRTTSPSTGRTSTTRSSASSGAASARPSRSTSTRSRRSSSWPTARTPSTGAPHRAS